MKSEWKCYLLNETQIECATPQPQVVNSLDVPAKQHLLWEVLVKVLMHSVLRLSWSGWTPWSPPGEWAEQSSWLTMIVRPLTEDSPPQTPPQWTCPHQVFFPPHCPTCSNDNVLATTWTTRLFFLWSHKYVSNSYKLICMTVCHQRNSWYKKGTTCISKCSESPLLVFLQIISAAFTVIAYIQGHGTQNDS